MKSIFPIAVFCCVFAARAAHFTTSVAEAIGQTWSDPIWDPGATAPVAGNTYEILSGGLARNPMVASSTFPGDSLQLDTNSILRMKSPASGTTTTVNFPGVNGGPGLILNGGGVDPGNTDTTFVVGGRIFVAADSLLLGPAVDFNRNLVFTAAISGTGSVTIQNFFNNSGATIQSASNSFSGDWNVKAGRLTGSVAGSLGTGNITISAGSRLEILYNLDSPGVLKLDGMMALTRNCKFPAVIINGTSLRIGTYSYAELKAQFPSNFPATGAGSVTLAPPDLSVSISLEGNQVAIRFKTIFGRTYFLQKAASVDATAAWQIVGGLISGDGADHAILDPAASVTGFYRVLVQ